jgi:hypothetical protein
MTATATACPAQFRTSSYRTVAPAQLRRGDIVVAMHGEAVDPRMVLHPFDELPGLDGEQGIELEGRGGVRCILYRRQVEQLGEVVIQAHRQRGCISMEGAAGQAAQRAGWLAHGGHYFRPTASRGPRTPNRVTRKAEDAYPTGEVYTGMQGRTTIGHWMRQAGWIVEIDRHWYVTSAPARAYRGER